MAPRVGSRVPRTVVAAAALLLVALLAGGFAGSGGFGFLSRPAAETANVLTPTPDQSAATETASATASPTESPTATATESSAVAAATESLPAPTATPSATASARAMATPTRPPTPRPATPTPTPTPTPTNLRFASISRPILYCGLTGTYHVSVENNGPVATSGPTHLWMSDTYGSGPVAFYALPDIPVLAAGRVFEIEVPVLITTGCNQDHSMYLEIDPWTDIAETTRSDNSNTYSHHVDNQGPDLKFIDPPRADRATCRVPFHVHMGVDNAGTASTGGGFVVTVQDRVGTTLVATQSVVVAAFPAHTSRSVLVSMTVGSRCGVTHILTITLDSAHAIDETHEDNNTATTNYVLNNA